MRFPLVFISLLLACPSACSIVCAESPNAITHSFFVAGPSLTGIIDEDGSVIWDAKQPAARDGFMLPSGNVLVAWKDEVKELTRENKVVFSYRRSKDNAEIGTVERLQNGNTLITELGKKPRLLEVDPAGKVVVDVPLKPDTNNAHMQTRMARKLANGNYLVPHLLAFAVKEYTPDGQVVKQFVTDTDALGGRDAHNWPFTAIRTPSGTTVIGCTHGNRVIEVDGEGNIIWQVTNEDVGGIIDDACGVQRLANGNTVIASYHTSGKGVKLFEVTPQKQVVWKYSGPHRVHHFQVLTTNGIPETGRPMK